jgi:hypothetical protein
MKQKVGNDCGATLRTLHKQTAAGAVYLRVCRNHDEPLAYLRLGHIHAATKFLSLGKLVFVSHLTNK